MTIQSQNYNNSSFIKVYQIVSIKKCNIKFDFKQVQQMPEAQSVTSPQKQKSAFQKVNEQCAQFRQQIINLKNQKGNLSQTIKKYQNELKIFQVKYKSIQAQLQKQRGQNHKFIQQLQKEKKQKAQIVTNQQNVLNSMSRDQIQLSKMTSQNKNLKQQNEKLQKQFQIQQVDRVNYIKDKQNTINKITLLQTKLEAATMELKFVKIKSTQHQTENIRLRDEVSKLQKTLSQKQGPLKVQTIYKDQSSTKQKLLNQFQEKIKDKQQVMRQQIQKYELKNAELTQKVAYLETQLKLVK